MIKVDNIDVFNFEGAIRGMRNPLNSWSKSDSKWNFPANEYQLGASDLALMRKLYKGGTEHRKFMRQILVSMDITAPLYWIAEFDTYKIGTTRNSCSFMHRGIAKPFDITDFSIHCGDAMISSFTWGKVIAELNVLRDSYLATKDEQIFQQIRCLLPSGYNQKFTVTMNYENVVNIINQRSHHRLDEWREFCEILLQELPYIREITKEE